MSTLKILVPY